MCSNVFFSAIDAPSSPEVVASPRSQNVAQGATVVLYCIARANTTVHYTWYLNGSVCCEDSADVLKLDNLQQDGHYSCRAYNDYGSDTRNATITVVG